MRTRVVAALVLASSLGLSPSDIHAQRSSSELALSYGPGSAFNGAAVGLARTSAAGGSAFSFAAGSAPAAYGIYDDGYWGSRYFGGRTYSRWGGYGCADVWSVLDGPYHGAFAAGFYDDWFYLSDLYYDCVARGPSWVYHRYHAYRPFYHGYRPYRYFRPRGIHISIVIGDPFWPVWGPYWAYDPWGHFNWVVYSGHPRVRTVYVSPSPVYRRPSPIYVAGTTFKEDPRGGAPADAGRGRSAQPRPSSAPAATAPATGLAGIGIQAPPRRSAGTSGGTAEGATLSAPTGGRTAEPRRGDSDGRSSAPVAPGPTGNGRMAPERPSAPATGSEPARRGAPPVQGQPAPSRRGEESSTIQTPSSVNRPSSRAGEGRPTSTLPQVITPQTRPSSSDTRLTPPDDRSERLPQVISPRRSGSQATQPAEEAPAAERLTGPAGQPRQSDRPSPGAAESQGVPTTYPTRQAQPVRSRPSDAATPERQPAQRPEWSTAPRAQPDRGAPSERQASPTRQAQPQPREAPRESRPSPPETRQGEPRTRQSPAPQAREAPPPQTRQAPPPQTRQAPTRPSGGQAQPAPQSPPSGGARPVPVPRRPGG